MRKQSKPAGVQGLGGLGVALVLAMGLAGCGSGPAVDGGASEDGASSTSPSATASADAPLGDVDDSAVEADLRAALAAVESALADFQDADQVILDPAATEVSIAYGAVQVPFTPSEATDRVTGTVKITDGRFEISATSATSGLVYIINQDGNVTQE